MKIESIPTVDQLRQYLQERKGQGQTVGLVPTMGALHEGHGCLMDQARGECDVLVVSVFVNRLQFGPEEDLDSYPRDLAQDLLFCELRGVDVVFAPSNDEIYSDTPHTFVEHGVEGNALCGESRPGHFRGVATIVLKLFNIVQPNRAYFGEKDIQQLAVIGRMTRDFNLPIELVEVPTQREPDGLAISSRNQYLNSEERQAAGVLYRALRIARQRIADGNLAPSIATKAARTVLDLEPLAQVEYLEIVDPNLMQPVDEITGPVRVVGAICIGSTRLIDNVLCEMPKSVRNRRRK
jgi:pantoate--beta-alanine ligase